MKQTTPLIAVIALLVGIFLGLQLEIARLPHVHVLAKTDGAICWASFDTRDDPATGSPHWLVRADGACYVDDLPK